MVPEVVVAWIARRFLELHAAFRATERPEFQPDEARLLSCAGQGSVSFVESDQPITYGALFLDTMAMRVLGLRPGFWHALQRCGRCRLHATQLRITALAQLVQSGLSPSGTAAPHRLAEDLLADHVVRCPHGLRLAGQVVAMPSAVTEQHRRVAHFVRDALH